ncbi:MAG: serine/threonine protein kinase [Alphaproteobacteria bacterium]|nr:serine/threonine protein kinase [Alphaproteobacteria bacterium]
MGSPTYTVHKCLGRGGFGEVYLATRKTHEGLEKKVAIKVLREDVPNAEQALARLRDEARMLALLDHPAIVAVIELTRLDGRIALVTEYVEGTDLCSFTRVDHLLPTRVACEAASAVADALAVACDTPSPDTGRPLMLIHRDIKPENIRLSRHGEIKLLDFGIARSTQMTREARTATGNVPFTIGYTAPETFSELVQHPPSDVFALGATLYRLLTGDRFYEALKLSEQAGLSARSERFSEWHESRMARLWAHPPELTALVGQMTSFDPDARPTSLQVQTRLEEMSGSLPGPSIRRWVREVVFHEPSAVEGPLVGRVLVEERADASEVFVRKRHPPAPPPPPTELIPVQPAWRESSTDGPPSAPGAPPASSNRLAWMALSLSAALLLLAAVAGVTSVVLMALWMAM